MKHGEGFTIGLFDDLACTEAASGDDCIESEPAFRLLATAVSLVLEQRETSLVECAFELLSQLVRCSATTEMPGLLRQRWRELGASARACSSWTLTCWQGIEEWYRLRDATS